MSSSELGPLKSTKKHYSSPEKRKGRSKGAEETIHKEA
jgi:hypothetical protein